MFNRTASDEDLLGGTYGESDLDFYEGIHNSKYLSLILLYLVLEVYLWLGNKFDKEFVEMELCLVMT